MSLKFCKSCGTLYDDKNGPCPRCADMEDPSAPGGSMPPEELRRLRTRGWIQLTVGIPALIGLFYLVFGLFKRMLTK